MPKHKHDAVLISLIGSRIQAARLARGMTQAELAEAIGIEPITLSRYETGARGASVTTIAMAADVLGVAVGDLVDRERVLPAPDHAPEILAAIRVLEHLDDEQRDLALRLIREVAQQ